MTEEGPKTIIVHSLKCAGASGSIEEERSVSYSIIDKGIKEGEDRTQRYIATVMCPLFSDSKECNTLPSCYIYEGLENIIDKL